MAGKRESRRGFSGACAGWVGGHAAMLFFLVLAVWPAWAGDWPQWGGPGRNFSIRETRDLSVDWSTSGPKVLWKKPLGDGYSALLVHEGVIYAMTREAGDAGKELVLALKAANGEEIWRRAYEAPVPGDVRKDFGVGPRSTPLLVDGRLFTVGVSALFQCLDAKTGNVLWSKDLADKYGVSSMGFGYGPSPMAYKDNVIVVTGGSKQNSKHGLSCFKRENGEVVWESEPFSGGYPSPMPATIAGKEMVLVAAGQDRLGLDLENGKILWRFEAPEQFAAVFASPVWAGDDIVVFSAAYGGGTHALRITKEGDGYKAAELWHYLKMQVHHGSSIVRDGLFIGSSGDFGPAFMTAMDIKSGEVLWRDRSFAKANTILVGDRLIILDEQGKLGLATPGKDGLTINGTADLLEFQAWTVPTYVDGRLYLRDRKTIMALELPK